MVILVKQTHVLLWLLVEQVSIVTYRFDPKMWVWSDQVGEPVLTPCPGSLAVSV